MLKKALSLAIFSIICLGLHAQTVSGRVVDENGAPLAYANVYWKSSITGTTTNFDGEFNLNIPVGGGTLVVRFIGYNYYEQEITSSKSGLEIQLSSKLVELGEVIVTGDEDPAYRIIREAIAKRKYHLKQVYEYSSKVYIKGTIRLNDIPDKPPAFIPKFLAPDTNDLGLLFLTESQSDYFFQQPDKKKEEMTASRIAGFNSGFSWNRASEMEVNLYKNSVFNEYYSERDIISPISDRAFFFYKYKLEGIYIENGVQINKIKVIPKRKADPVFAGYIYIIENLWAIHSFDLGITKASGLLFADTLYLGRNYFPYNDSTWMPLSNHVKARYNLFGYDATEQYVAYFENYDIEPNFEKGFFGAAVFAVDNDAKEKDSIYWDSARTVILTEEELSTYEEQDSLADLRESPAYMDSLDKALNKPRPLAIMFTGYTYGKRYYRSFFSVDPVISMFSYNTVEGFNINLSARYSKWKEDYKQGYRISAAFKYGVGNKQFNAKGFFAYRISRKRFESVGFGAGRYSTQYNNENPIGPFINMTSTLFVGDNYMKLYDAIFGTVKYQRELFNGFFLHADFTYAHRRPLVNVTDYTFRKEEKSNITSNDPQNPDSEAEAFEAHNAAYLKLEATYRPSQKFESYPNRKVLLGSKWPTFYFAYQIGLEMWGSKVNYDFLEFGVGDSRRLGLVGLSEYDVYVGGFVNNVSMEFMDYKHFLGSQTYYQPYGSSGSSFGNAERSPNRRFQALPYYGFSTNRYFVEAHYTHHFKGFFFNKIPGIRKLKMQLVTGLNFLYTPEQKEYFEFVAGIENIFRVLRFDLVTNWGNSRKPKLFFRFGANFDF